MTEPRTLTAVWISGAYLYVRDDTGQKYAVCRDSWRFPYLASIVRVRRRLRLDSKPLWEGCDELTGVELVKEDAA